MLPPASPHRQTSLLTTCIHLRMETRANAKRSQMILIMCLRTNNISQTMRPPVPAPFLIPALSSLEAARPPRGPRCAGSPREGRRGRECPAAQAALPGPAGGSWRTGGPAARPRVREAPGSPGARRDGPRGRRTSGGRGGPGPGQPHALPWRRDCQGNRTRLRSRKADSSEVRHGADPRAGSTCAAASCPVWCVWRSGLSPLPVRP